MSAEHLGPALVHAYVLVRIDPDKAATIFRRLTERIPDATVFRVSGEYDIIIDVESEGQEYVAAMVRDQVRAVPGVVGHDVLWVAE
jgi:DNA-binding Lrp family transcriptional regulator